MKPKPSFIELCLCLACALAPAALWPPNATSTGKPANESVRADRQVIEGRVEARSDTSLKVDGKVIAVTATTSFMKAGKIIFAADVRIGDGVKIVASVGTDGSLAAELVEVHAKE